MIIVGDEGDEVGITLCVVDKAAVVGGAVLRHSVEMFADAAVEALDHCVGLRVEGLGDAVADGAGPAEGIERVVSDGLSLGL